MFHYMIISRNLATSVMLGILGFAVTWMILPTLEYLLLSTISLCDGWLMHLVDNSNLPNVLLFLIFFFVTENKVWILPGDHT